VFLIGVAHLPGENSTVWRTDAELTNPDNQARQWKVEFLPKQNLPAVNRTVSLGAYQSLSIQDLVAWLYDPLSVPDASGVVHITSADGSLDAPVVAARTYNLTADGTFGQGLPALDPSKGATAAGVFKHLYLTGMSSQDVARSNLGFVNLGAGGVNFDVFLYDEGGTMLNPNGAPLSIYLPTGGWDQDKLENRFKNTFGVDLPAGLRAISAVVKVTNGGPGYVYASVVDGVTGDPVFIGGQLAP
jgi:hypothetical protein